MKEELGQAFTRFVDGRQTVTIFPAKVTSVNKIEATIDAIDAQGIEYLDVRLRAVIDEDDNGLLIFPEADSSVLIGNIGNSPNSYCVLLVSTFTKFWVKRGDLELKIENDVLLKSGNTEVVLNAEGVKLQKSSETLKAILKDLMTNLQALTVTCASPGSPSTVPINAASFATLSSRIENLFD